MYVLGFDLVPKTADYSLLTTVSPLLKKTGSAV